ncbi:response regulator receiver domain [Alteromonas macleodii]|uniref:response regulator receiver domain n=1 Tax=Alteromonas macleodii TaxID=28108 RepID=UPI003BF7C04B
MLESYENSNFKSLVRKAYIDPIKSVLAIDDQYYSLDGLLDSIQRNTHLTENTELSRQLETLRMVRSRNWLADMHDGQGDPTIFERLHQCDLLLLDYHLDKANPDDPEQALNILSKLNENHHFNLVIVYTAAENLKEVRTEIFSKLSSDESNIFNIEKEYINDLIKEWEEEGESYTEEMLEKISKADLELALTKPSTLNDDETFEALFTPIELILDSNEIQLPCEEKNKLYIKLLELKIQECKSNGDFSGKASVSRSDDVSPSIWLRTDKLFIAIVSKQEVSPSDLIDCLENAIENWSPTCHRLLLSKIKQELDDNGQSFENEILKCKYTNAGWLEQFTNTDEFGNGTHLTISRLMEGLSSSLHQNKELNDYANDLKQYIELETFDKVMVKESNDTFNSRESSEAIKMHLNSYICSQQPVGKHLMPGHIIEWKENSTTEYFVCLTPACDLVPRTAKGWKERLGDIFPVKLLKLEPHEDHYHNAKGRRKLAGEIVTGNHLFLKIDSKIRGFSYSVDFKSNPHWEQCYVENRGKTSIENEELSISLARTRFNPASLCLDNRFFKCRVVGHLRYEYAVNLINKLGTSLTRVGLDFVNLN